MKSNFLNSRFFTIWSNISDGIFVNVVFVFTCIPLFTYGAAKTALYETAVKWENEGDAGVKDYWKSFKANFKSAIIPGIIMLAAGFIVFLDYQIIRAMPDLMIVAAIIMVLYYMYKEQLFLLNARILYPTRQLFQNAVRMMFSHPLMSFVGAAFCFVPVILLAVSPVWFLRLTPLWIMGWFSLGAWLTVKIGNKEYLKLFEAMGVSKGEENEDNGTDQNKEE